MDRLVRLYDLPSKERVIETLQKEGVTIRTARAYEKTPVVSWVRNQFGDPWADECSVAFSHHPASCYIASENGEIIGFACYEATSKNFFGPIGVVPPARGRSIGKALLLSCLHAMASMGYAYAVIGGGDRAKDFYSKTVDAMEIAGSSPGIYRDRLKGQ